MKTEYKPRIVRGRVEIWVPHNSREVAFASPSVRLNTYCNVGREILKNGQRVPHGDYTASLLHPVYCNDSVANVTEFMNVREVMKKDWLLVFNRNLWAAKGVYVLQDTEAIGMSQPLDINKLEKMLNGGKEINGVTFSKDGRLRFAPKGSYRLEEHTPESLAKDGFMIASCGKEGAEKLGEVSVNFGKNPSINGVKVQEGEIPKQRVSAVCEYYERLYFIGDIWDDIFGGHAFGVCK